METFLKDLGKSKREITIELSAQEFYDFFKKALTDLSRDLEVEGFRRGKVPSNIALKKLGEEKVLAQAVERAVRESYVKAVRDKNIEPISQPQIEVVKAPALSDLSLGLEKSPSPSLIFKAKVQVLPGFDLPDYKKIAAGVEKREIKVEEKEVQEALNWLQKSRAKRSQVLRPCQKGDFVEMEFSSPQLQGGLIQKDGFILGQGRLIPGFEENLEGLAPGREKEFTLTFPKEHFQKDLAGKEIKFRAKIKSVQKVELPELNDQFAKEVGTFESFEGLKKSIQEGINKEKEMAESQRLRGEILEKIVQQTNVEIPDILAEREKERMLQEMKQNIEKQFRLSFADYLGQIKKSEQELLKSFGEPAQKRARNFLVLRAISQKEGIEATDEEVAEKIQQFFKNYPSPEKAEKEVDPVRNFQDLGKKQREQAISNGVDLPALKDYTKEAIVNEKTLAFLESFSKS